MMYWLCGIIGFVIGELTGVALMCLMVSAKDGDHDNRTMECKCCHNNININMEIISKVADGKEDEIDISGLYCPLCGRNLKEVEK